MKMSGVGVPCFRDPHHSNKQNKSGTHHQCMYLSKRVFNQRKVLGHYDRNRRNECLQHV